MDNTFFNKLEEKVRPYYENVGGHEFEHAQRVYNISLSIAKDEGADLDITGAAALLHDIAREKQEKGECRDHAEEGAIIAKNILTEINFPNNKIDKVCYAIRVHRYSQNIRPETIEALILQDADRLEVLGATIVGRCFSYDGKHNIPIYNPKIQPKEKYVSEDVIPGINHFYEKSFKLKPETFFTKKAQKLAKGRYDFLKNFVEQFIKEWDGER